MVAFSRRLWALVLPVLWLASGPAVAAAPAAAGESECHVRYVSAESVYLDAGSDAGLAVGDRVRIERGGKAVAELEVAFVAEHSASCRLISGTAAVAAGDRAVYVKPAAAAAAATPDTLVSRARAGTAGEAAPRSRPADRVDGWVAVQWDHTVDASERDLATDLVSLPFRVRARDLGRDWEFRARGSLRHVTRSGFGEATPAAEWRNRVLEAAVVREGRGLGWQFAFGRVGSRQTAAAGPFDGLVVTRRLGATTSLGAFGGWAPAWGELAFSADDQVAGAVFRLDRATPRGRVLDFALSAVGRYHQGEIDREYFMQTFTWRDGGRWSLLEAAEVDLYRGWRQEGTGRTLALTGAALNGRCQVSSALALTLGYDGREPVRTWETRSLPDSLFSEASRDGWRAGAAWRGAGGVGVDLSGGVRHEQGTGQDVTSWQALLRVPGRRLGGLDAMATARGFDGPWLSGWSPSLRLARAAGSTRWSLEAGYFAYTGQLADQTRDNTWAELSLSHALAAGWDTTASYRQDWGDDITGRRLFVELARRF